MNEADKLYLQVKKQLIVDKCECRGLNINCQCWKNFQIEVRKVSAGIPSKYRDYNFEMIDHVHVQDNKKIIMDYTHNIHTNYKKGMGLFLHGTSGLAKTALGNIVLMYAVANGYSALYTSLSKCITYLTKGWYDEEAQNEYIEKVIETDFLLIDNIGDEFKSTNSNLLSSTFNNIFRERTDKMLPIIITSNYNEKTLGGMFGSPMVSLFEEHMINLEFKGSDYRKVKGQIKRGIR